MFGDIQTMSNAGLLSLLATPAVLLWLMVHLYRQYSRLSHIPGPRSAGFCKWWLVRSTLSSEHHLDLYKVCKRYASITRVGPNDLITDEPELAKRILAVRSGYSRSSMYDGMRFDPAKNNIISMRDDAMHNIMRNKMAPGYSGREVEGFEAKVDENVSRLISLLGTYVDNGKPVDFARKIHYFTVDVVSHLAFGEPFGDLASDTDVHGYIQTMEKYMPILVVSTVMAWVRNLLFLPIFRPLLPTEHDVLGVGRIMRIAKDVAAERYGPDKKVVRDMVGSFVTHGLTMEQTESEIAAQLVAGSDTTAAGIRATMLYIITNPRVYSILQGEIRRSQLSWPSATDAEIRAMPYLQATIREGLRLFPPVSGPMFKQVPPEGDAWNGIVLPGGTRIGFSMWGMLRRSDVWGEDSDEFRPERWLEVSPTKRKDMDSNFDLVFAAGKWGCLGRTVATTELNKVLVELLRRFDWSLVDPTQPWSSSHYTIFLQSEFWVRGARRKATETVTGVGGRSR